MWLKKKVWNIYKWCANVQNRLEYVWGFVIVKSNFDWHFAKLMKSDSVPSSAIKSTIMRFQEPGLIRSWIIRFSFISGLSKVMLQSLGFFYGIIPVSLIFFGLSWFIRGSLEAKSTGLSIRSSDFGHFSDTNNISRARL